MKRVDYDIILLNLGQLYWLANTSKNQKLAEQYREIANNILGVLRRTIKIKESQ